ncbi:unnamed protein product [Caenorhabditis sp. 36 PRJEB53466]|nr:unnamed protein product [Caenorhabditis sp. 36 PRJEB53466]
MMGLFGKKKDPKEEVRELQRKMRQEMRALERQITAIAREEQKVTKEIKASAKKGDKEVCLILAKSLVQSRKAINKIHMSKAQINSVIMCMQEQLATMRMAGSLQKSTEVMKSMQQLVKVPEIMKTMREMSSEMMKLGIIEEMIEETLESVEAPDLEEKAAVLATDHSVSLEPLATELLGGAVGGVGPLDRDAVVVRVLLSEGERVARDGEKHSLLGVEHSARRVHSETLHVRRLDSVSDAAGRRVDHLDVVGVLVVVRRVEHDLRVRLRGDVSWGHGLGHGDSIRLRELGLYALDLYSRNLAPSERFGGEVGIYRTWNECKTQVDGFQNPRFKKFGSEAEARKFIAENVTIAGTSSKSPFVAGKSRKRKAGSPSSSDASAAKRNAVEGEEVIEPEFVNAPVVYTDGACSSNGRKNAKAGWGVYWGEGSEDNAFGAVYGAATNNRGELIAVEKALEKAIEKGLPRVVVKTDSKLLIQSMTMWIQGWKRKGWVTSTGTPVLNKDVLVKIDNLRQKLKVKFIHVRGHAGIHGNEMADELARKGAQLYQQN